MRSTVRKTLLLATTLILALSACRAEINFAVDVAEDGSGDVTFELGLDEDMLELLEGFGGTEQLFEALPEDQQVESRIEGEFTYFSSSVPFTNPDQLLETASSIQGADANFAELDLEVTDEAATLQATIEAPSATEVLEGLGGSGLGGFDLTDDVLTSNLFVRLPGELIETNADEVLEDGTLRWDIPVTGGTVDVRAVTTGLARLPEEGAAKAGGSSLNWPLLMGVVVAIIGLAAVAWLSQRGRRAAEAAVTDTPEPEAPSPLVR